MAVRSLFLSVVLFLVTTLLVACTESSSSEFRSSCGTVIREELRNPVEADDGERITITSAGGGNLVVVRDDDGEASLVKLHSLSDELEPEDAVMAEAFLETFRGEQGYFFEASDEDGEECTVDVLDGVETLAGQVITDDGVNLSEAILKAGLAVVESGDDCEGELLEGCYAALIIEGPRPVEDNPA